MTAKNIAYRTDQIARYFAQNRVSWGQFYASERVIIERLGPQLHHEILDIGCGCGGLGLALKEKFGVETYTGVEINAPAAAVARTLNADAVIHCGDVLEISRTALQDRCFDIVFSLSCVDWNVQYEDMLAVAWKHVRPGGSLVATFRLRPDEGCNRLDQSYQYINYDGLLEGEQAAYVVLNARDLVMQLSSFDPSAIDAYGYWGVPSATAVTPYQSLCFSAFSVRKRGDNDLGDTNYRLDLPSEILDTLALPAQ